jgi:hypothetical protein
MTIGIVRVALRRLSRWCGAYSDDVRLEAQTFGSEGREPLAMTIGGKVVDLDSLPIHIAEIAQPVEKRVKSW